MRLTPADLDRLEELAREATPGKRVACADGTDPDRCDGIVFGPIPPDPFGAPGEFAWYAAEALVRTDSGVYPPRMPDARFIAACDAETILALVDELRGWRIAGGVERTAGPARCIPVEPETPEEAPVVGRAEPAPPIVGNVETVYSQLVPFDAKTTGLVVELNGVRFERAPRWIPVEERLPEDPRPARARVEVLLGWPGLVKRGYYALGPDDDGRPHAEEPFGFYSDERAPHDPQFPRYWMPLPAPPSPEGK